MTGSAGDVGSGAVKGAAIGAPLGPYGMAAGAIGGGLYGWLSGGPSQAEKDASAASAAHVTNGKNNAIALENYRQNARDQYHQLLVNETTPYQAYSNRLAAGWGQGMSTAGLSANENPLTLRDTGVGAPIGSNYAGYETKDPGGGATFHQGIGAYLDGNNMALGPKPSGNRFEVVNGGNGINSGTHVNGVVDADPLHTAQTYDTSLNPTYNASSMGLQPGGGPQGTGAGLSFHPRGR